MVTKEKNIRLFGAPLAMRRKGAATDAVVLGEIMKKPGITVSEIAETFGWSNGKVDGSINRLCAEGKVSVKHYLQRGMLVKRVYPKEYHVKPGDIQVPEKMVNRSLWTDSAVVYALSRSTIGVAPEQVEEWDKKALFKDCARITRDKENIVVTMPERFCDFYQLENSDMSVSAIGNFILVTVESVIPVNLPSSYSEEENVAITRVSMMLKSEKTKS
ncbi:MAG: winged helix-turn-helix domain-containing protein [Candidatus Bathyarchaeota archaeon]|nr:winged helix-turn-helix domain-containing protein [Candidatus Bathyarchaeota archaeon]